MTYGQAILFVALCIIAKVVQLLWSVKRFKAFRLRYGLDLTPHERAELNASLQNFYLMSRRDGYINWLTRGQIDNLSIACFRYFSIVTRTHNLERGRGFFFNVVLLELDAVQLPTFLLEPENFFQRVGADLAFHKDYDFKAHPDFLRTWQLSGDDEEAIRAFLTPELLDFLSEFSGFCLEASGDRLLVYSKEPQWRSKEPQWRSTKHEELIQSGLAIANAFQSMNER